MSTHAEAIIEAFKTLRGIRTIAEIKNWVDNNYKKEWKAFGTIMADMVPISHGGNRSSIVPKEFKVLERVGSGRYRLLNEVNGKMNEEDILRKKYPDDHPTKSTFKEHMPRGEKSIKKITVYEVNNAIQLLDKTYDDLKQIVKDSESSHESIQRSFAESGWSIEQRLLGSYRCDAHKDGIVVEIEGIYKSSVIDVLHRDLFRFMMLQRMGKLKIGVLITTISSGEWNLEKVKSDMDIYGKYFDTPLLVLGI